MPQTDVVLKQLADQVKSCEQLGSPFTARICRVLATRLDARSRFGRRILDWEGDPYADNVALRACGALHALARSGWEPNLSAVYPPNEANERQLWVAIADALQHHDSFLTDRLSSPPQTNEVARSAILLGGMLHVAQRTGLPLELFEIGASAGLNLGLDDYRYELGEGRVWGSAKAPLIIASAWRGATPPLDAPLRIVARHGCDLNPLDPRKLEDRERLLSYVWADQSHRLQRVDAALGMAAAKQRVVEKADAGEWVPLALKRPQAAGTARVLFHTIVWQYMPTETRQRIEAALAEAGARATAETPLARLAFEPDDMPGSARLDLTLWPGGQTVTLGRGDYHGRWAEWA